MARIWQLLIAAQPPLAARFALIWFPKRPKPARQVLALRAMTWLANFGVLY
jgi:hypothetical protein